MTELWVWPAYMATGIVAGLSAGMFGVGGGLIIVPALAVIFHHTSIISQNAIHIAVGTSLAVIVFTSIASVLEHNRHGAVIWRICYRLAPALVIGSLMGSFLASQLASEHLKTIFGIVEITIAIQLYVDFRPQAQRQLPGWAGLSLVGIFIGAVSTIVGIGGGTMTGPFLNWCNIKIHNAVATSAACGVPIAVAGSVSYIYFGKNSESDITAASGFIYWPAFLTIVFASMLAAPFGARIAHRLPNRQLKKSFAFFLCVVGLSMLLF